MAKKTEAKLDSKTSRAKIAPGGDVQKRIGKAEDKGWYLIYRKHKSDRAGSWQALWVDTAAKRRGENRRFKETIGPADDVDGHGLTFDEAKEKAEAFCRRCMGREVDEGRPDNPESITVADVIADYFQHKEATGERAKGLAIYRSMADAWIVPKLGSTSVTKLKLKKLNDWKIWFIGQPRRGNGYWQTKAPKTADEIRARKATCNRVITILRAALTHAVDNNDDLARECVPYQWRNFKGFDKADGKREGTLASDDRQKLIKACDADFGLLVKAALLTGCRHGELRLAQAKHYQHTPKGNGYLLIPADNAKSGRERKVKLTRAGAHFFYMQVTGKAPDDAIFTRTNGTPWRSGSQLKPMKKACADAGIAPLVFHELRHTRATALEAAGLDYMLIQLQMGHAIGGITETYLHRDPDHISELLEEAIGADDWSIVGRPEAGIAPLRTKRRA